MSDSGLKNLTKAAGQRRDGGEQGCKQGDKRTPLMTYERLGWLGQGAGGGDGEKDGWSHVIYTDLCGTCHCFDLKLVLDDVLSTWQEGCLWS